ncbi:MAG: SDR family NAD(P)-dependent oxidoreductase [Ardenticatenaceae bacterium]|nr:SDR family NAD(P)-dependent oxidoreductase [Ardenticatenaceae bacterium]MCB9444412.1 SDR family NAD(P)-dependent oxidoreductase [Ardenticatenaceae bacterium]
MINNKHWAAGNIPDQSGRIAIVTGANSGIGYETARVLAHQGATTILACRNEQKGKAAVEKIQSEGAKGTAVFLPLDLADLDSIHAFANSFKAQYQRLDLLINNAGIMTPPFGQTKQGFETQFGVNHLGHFALTGLLLDLIQRTPQSRIVTVSSIMHKGGKINFDDLNSAQSYNRSAAYGQSKLANLLFTYELQRKLEAAGSDTIAVAAHPGWTDTNLQQHAGLIEFFNRFLAQKPEMGALPTLRAAVDANVQGADYYGPTRRFETVGYPEKVQSNGRSHDQQTAAKLWDISEELTGVHYDFARQTEA